ncbi:MAG: hypothetical protein ACLFPE_07125 [Bacteroidales bacterium]
MISFKPGKDRVRSSTSDSINAEIDRQINERIARYASSDEAAIKNRIKELDKEWDIERTLEINAASFALAGVILGATVNKKWLILPGIVTTFLAQHALQGWCPPLPLFRKFKIRTRKEIDKERYALVELLKK